MAGHFLGIDLGSSYTKLVAMDAAGAVAHAIVVPTFSRRRDALEQALEQVRQGCDIQATCATGYGRMSVPSDLQKTELLCAAAGVSTLHPIPKWILDIGGEDIKVIECDGQGRVLNFHMNDKCSAGTGTFITEIAERAELDLGDMSRLAEAAAGDQMMNSFCTVFAKSEILGWKFSGVAPETIARGIYLSVVDRVAKLPMAKGLPVFMCGGVIAHHPVLAHMLASRMGAQIQVVEHPQFAVALGAAVFARAQAG